MNEKEQLEKLIIFLTSKCIVSMAKISSVIEISLSDFHIIYGDKISKQIEKDLNDNKS